MTTHFDRATKKKKMRDASTRQLNVSSARQFAIAFHETDLSCEFRRCRKAGTIHFTMLHAQHAQRS